MRSKSSISEKLQSAAPSLRGRAGVGLLLLLLIVLCACGKLESEYNSTYRCRFILNNSLHNNAKIMAACNSWGTFLHITMSGPNAIRLELYGQDPEVVQAVATEEPSKYSLGIDNSSGLYVGCSTLNNGTLYAFDGQCPNCFTNGASGYRLTFSQSGQWLYCPTCHRHYDLNNSGIITQGDPGKKLYRYHAAYDGTFLRINN